MICGGCQSQNPAGNRFCDRCGAPLARLCPTCGRENRADARFCGGCGRGLDDGAAAPSAAAGAGARPLAVADYTPQHLAARILSSRLTLAGERKQVTVLFADIRGSTELIHDLDPEQALARLDPGLKIMMDAVHRYEGVVSRVQGDGIMALFGAPIAHEDHAVRACFAAHAMLEESARSAGAALRIRVGLNSGEVVVRSVGNDLSLEYDAVGITVHLAARMEQMALPGTARLSASTHKLARGFIEARSLGKQEVKGIAEPVEVFELTGVTRSARWEARAATHGLSRFVGRQTELAVLSDAHKRALAGRGQIVAIVGEPGVGKSRLLHEFLEAHSEEDFNLLRIGAVPHDRHTPFLAIAELLRAWLDVADRDRQSEIGRKLAKSVTALDGQLSGALPPLRVLLDLPSEDAEWERLDPPLRRQRMRDAVRLLLLKAAAAMPLVLVVEDLHWVDAESEAVLDAVSGSIGAARLLLLATFRPEFKPDWARYGYFSLVRLNPLEDEAADQLLRSMLGEGKELEALRRRLVERCEGTPFFLEEMVRALSETGALAEGRLTRSLEEINIPHSVQAVLAARIDRLSADNRSLLQIASVIGKDVPLSLLQALAELPAGQLHEQLAALGAAEFLYEINPASGTEFTFKHALTHEVAYESMLLTRRRELHAGVVRAIEATYPDRLDELTERLADHALIGGLWPQAVDYCFKAGGRANQRSAHNEAIAHFRRALEALGHLPPEPAYIEQAIDARLGLRVALAAAGKHLEIVACLEEAEALARQLGDKRRQTLINISKCTILSVLGPLKEAAAAGELGCKIAEELDDAASIISASYALGQVHWYSGELDRAVEVLLPAATRLSSGLRLNYAGTTGSAAVLCVGCLANSYSFLGRFEEAFAASATAAGIAAETKRPYDLSYARIAHGLAHLVKGELERAVAALEEALGICRAGEIHLLVPATARYLARAYALLGRSREAVQLSEEALGLSNAQQLASLQAWCGSALASAQHAAGSWQAAEAAAALALEHARRHGYRPVEILALRALALAIARRSPDGLARADDLIREALAIAERIGMQPEVAHCHADLAEINARAGRGSAAQPELTAAIKLYRAMGMPWYITRAESAMS